MWMMVDRESLASFNFSFGVFNALSARDPDIGLAVGGKGEAQRYDDKSFHDSLLW
jgi:hypothetical protein